MLRRQGMYVASLGFAVILVLGGCTTRYGDFTVGSTKNISQLSQKGETVTGEDCSANLLGLIPIQGPIYPNLKTAIDRALERAKGDVVADAVISYYALPLVIFNQYCFKVEGKVAKAELGKR